MLQHNVPIITGMESVMRVKLIVPWSLRVTLSSLLNITVIELSDSIKYQSPSLLVKQQSGLSVWQTSIEVASVLVSMM